VSAERQAATPQSPGLPPGQALEGRLFRDPLTQLPNEHLFRHRLPAEFEWARDRESNGALLALRLDGIAAINAAHGRSGGDEALRAVASVLERHRAGAGRESHSAARLTGSLFGYCIPSCSAAEARAAADEIRGMVQKSELYAGRLTVSVGVANYYEMFMENGTREALALRIEQVALQRLAVAEKQGGNTVCDASDTAAAVPSRRPVVLLVDPDPQSMELLVHALQAADIEVHVCEDGESAAAAVRESPPRLIICEAMTPRLDGFALREQLRANVLWNSIPFVMVSHRKNDDTIGKAVQADIRHFFRKPVNLAEVAGLVTNILRSPAE
jgi:diguanylate cyclase (GGDEF)-like protein